MASPKEGQTVKIGCDYLAACMHAYLLSQLEAWGRIQRIVLGKGGRQ
jgi:hypothetical protein